MRVLLVVDVQNDFCPGGALAAPNGDEVVPVINKLIPDYDWIIFTQDWHPPDHGSFASQHPGKHPFDMGELAGEPQMLWPDHCVWGTHGAMLHPDLHLPHNSLFVLKGYDSAVDCYSAFRDGNGHPTDLVLVLLALESREVVDHLDICGLTTDYCVRATVLDAIDFRTALNRENYKIRVLSKAVRAVDPNTTALDEMRAAGAEIV
jgi:nicotinamidase/pyrazinamidase